MNKKHFDCLIIGAGAAGLMCGAYLSYLSKIQNKALSICIVERNSKVGRKLLATGNGKCNFTNISIVDGNKYYSDKDCFVNSVISDINGKKIVDIFDEILGVKATFKNELVYPYTLRSSTVADSLYNYCLDNKVEFIFDTCVDSNSLRDFDFSYLVLATGGSVLPKSGSDGKGFFIIPNIDLVKPVPALVQLNSSDKDIKSLSGKRYSVNVWLENMPENFESGELLFTDYGVSGICVMQLSSFEAELFTQNNRFSDLCIDFFPNIELDSLIYELENRIKKFTERDILSALSGLVSDDLLKIVLDRLRINSDKVSSVATKRIATLLKCFRVRISGPTGFENAQITRGGISLKNLRENSFELNNTDGVYCIGEVLNVDGPCGGFNLHWAWVSAIKCAEEIISKL